MAEDALGKKELGRREFLGKLALGTAATAITVSGVSELLKILDRTSNGGDIFRGDVYTDPDSSLLLAKLKRTFPAVSANPSLFSVKVSAPEGAAHSTFAVMVRPAGDRHPFNRFFVLDPNGEAVELAPFRSQKKEGEDKVLWYIPGKEVRLGQDIGSDDKTIQGEAGMQPVIAYALTPQGSKDVIYFHRGDRKTSFVIPSEQITPKIEPLQRGLNSAHY